MSKDKLISLIIRKQTYKDTKSYLTDLLNLKQQAVKASHQAIKQVLTTDYNAQAKLYAVRYLKDAFEKANPSFTNHVEKEILPILVNISVDQNDQKAHMKYAGSSYTKSEELSKFKAIVSSLFRMVKECIIKWAEWIPDPNRKFRDALNQIIKKKVSLEFDWKYFRPENQQLFKQNCEKNGIKVSNTQLKQSKPASPPKPQPKKQSRDPLIAAIQASLQNVRTASTQKQIATIQNDFNEAINNYLENSENFKQELVQQSFDEFERLKKEAATRIKTTQAQKAKQSAAPASPSDPLLLSKQKNIKKVEQSSLNSKQSNKQQKTSVDKPLPPKQKIQQKIQNKLSTASKKQFNKPAQQNEKRQIASKVESSNLPANKKQSQKLLLEDPKKVQQPKKASKRQQPPIAQISKVKQEKIKSPRVLEEKKEKIVVQQQIKKVEAKPVIRSNQSKVPTSPKRGPIKFDDQQSPFSSQKPSVSVKEQSRIPAASKPSSHKKESRFDHSISKQESQRINFSDEESSQFSEDANHRIEPRDFKKKSQLTPIREETSHGPPEQSGKKSSVIKEKSLRMEEESFSNREKKGGVTHKLMEENKHLMERYEKLIHDHENEMQQKLQIMKQKQTLEKQIRIKAENEDRLIRKLKASVPMDDYNRLRKQFEEQRQKRQELIKQNIKIKNANQSLIEQLNETKYRLKGNQQNQKSRQKVNQSQSKALNVSQSTIKPVASVPVVKQEIDQIYVKNLTHISNLHNFLNKINLGLFKRNSLSRSEIFYRDEYVSIMAKSRVYTQNNEQFISTNLTFQFKSLKQVKPQVKYKNCQQLDLWIKPLTGQQDIYTQQLAIRLHSNPLKVIKAEVKIIEVIDIQFLLPILYINFLREQQFFNEDFDDIFLIKSEQLIKSKITQWNSQIIKEVTDLHKLFKFSVIIGDKVRFCLSEGINDQVFMAQFQILRNNKFLLRVLPIPYSESMITKAKQLIENITFLLS